MNICDFGNQGKHHINVNFTKHGNHRDTDYLGNKGNRSNAGNQSSHKSA
jgi:hypothetical protein